MLPRLLPLLQGCPGPCHFCRVAQAHRAGRPPLPPLLLLLLRLPICALLLLLLRSVEWVLPEEGPHHGICLLEGVPAGAQCKLPVVLEGFRNRLKAMSVHGNLTSTQLLQRNPDYCPSGFMFTSAPEGFAPKERPRKRLPAKHLRQQRK